MRNWPRYSRGSFEAEEITRPLRKKIFFSTRLVADDKRAGFLPEAEPLEQIAREHRFQVAADAHDRAKGTEKGVNYTGRRIAPAMIASQ